MEPTYIITASVRMFNGDAPAPGSVMKWCGICGDALYLSPAAIERMKDGAVPLCELCGIGVVAQNNAIMAPADPSIPDHKNRRAYDFIRAAAKRKRQTS